jgi:hypothetical protein
MASAKNSSQKDVIYVDVDDEITAIIDKLHSSSSKIVALVLPKRAAVMQSIVNMKLLKRTATESKKNVVLITSEASLLPLAGIAGLHVAPSLQSKPEVPEVGAMPGDSPIDVDVDSGSDEERVDGHKSDSQKVPATGQKDEGTKATGTVTLALGDCSSPQVTVPAGTIVSAGGLNFATAADAVLTSVKIGVQCRNSDFKEFSTRTVNVTAQNAGGQYNLSARSYTVAGFSNVSASGSSMTGGTSKVVKVVSQEDVDGAKQKFLDANNPAANQEVASQLKSDGYFPLTDTFAPGNPLVASTPNVGDEATDVTVNVTITYTMHGVKQDDLKNLLESEINKKIDTAKQKILNNGLDKAAIRITDKNPTQVKFSLQTVASAGVQQDSEAIKKAIAGKKKGEVQDAILARPGVKDVTVTYSPFWVYSTPSKASKITIVFQQSDGSPSGQ